MFLSLLAALAVSLCPMQRPDPSDSSVYPAAMHDHNEQGGRFWKYSDDASEASATVVGATNYVGCKFAMECSKAADYSVVFTIEHQSKLIEAEPIPGYETAWISGITVTTATQSFAMDPVGVYRTAEGEWRSCDPIVVPAIIGGSDLNSPDLGITFSAVQANDGAAFVNLRVFVTVTER